MEALSRSEWPDALEKAERSVLILAPWLDHRLVSTLLAFGPPLAVRVLFPRTTLEGRKEKQYLLQEARDINFDMRIRVTDENVPACFVLDGERFFYAPRDAELVRQKAVHDADAGMAMAEKAWEGGADWPLGGETAPTQSTREAPKEL